MANGSSFHDLKVWREAMVLVEDVYRRYVSVSSVRAFRSDGTTATRGGVDRVEHW